MSADLLKRIEKFLANPVDNGGEIVSPSKEDFDEFRKIVEVIRDLKWSSDMDGDPILKIMYVDRAYGWQPYTPVVPHNNPMAAIDIASSYALAANTIIRDALMDIKIAEMEKEKKS